MGYDRRDLLQYLGLTGLTGLTGCQETTPQTPTATSPAETASATTPDITLDIAVQSTDTGSSISVTGDITAPTDIVDVRITVGTTSRDPRIEPSPTIPIDETFQVDGGQSYEVEVTAKTSSDTEFSTHRSTAYVPMPAEGLSATRLVGVHYYPWYKSHDGHTNWTDRCIETPNLGEYAAADSAVIDQHLTWCLEHGIQWLSVSWWGEGTATDRTLSNALLDAEKFDQISFSILYETTRLEEFDFDLDNDRARRRLKDDLQYLETQYFSEDNYLHFDDRPVVFFYIAAALTGDVEAAFTEITRSLDTEVYVLADVPFGQAQGTAPISAIADGITSYNPYTAREDIESVFHDRYEQGTQTMNLSARAADIDFVPVVIPGYNDTEIPDSQREDNPVLAASPARYERVCNQVAPHLADSKAVLVTSFNEWYENTQIEPSERFGTAYLETTADRLATGTSSGFDPTGTTFTLTFNKTIVPAEINDESSDTRELAFMATGLSFYAGDQQVANFDIGVANEEPLFLQGVFGPGSQDGRTWRWLGGPTAEASMYIRGRFEEVDRAVLTGQPMQSDEITAEVSYDGVQTDSIDFGRRTIQSYTLELDP